MFLKAPEGLFSAYNVIYHCGTRQGVYLIFDVYLFQLVHALAFCALSRAMPYFHHHSFD